MIGRKEGALPSGDVAEPSSGAGEPHSQEPVPTPLICRRRQGLEEGKGALLGRPGHGFML